MMQWLVFFFTTATHPIKIRWKMTDIDDIDDDDDDDDDVDVDVFPPKFPVECFDFLSQSWVRPSPIFVLDG